MTTGVSAAGRAARVTVEYQGQGALTVHGRVTGSRYHFPGPAARASVDARDAPFLEVIQGLSVIAESSVAAGRPEIGTVARV